MFRSWTGRLPPEIEVLPVELPGRANRFHEPPLRSVDAIIAQASRALVPWFDRPLALFGHSMGAILAFELARWLQRGGVQEPCWLFVSGRRAPHLLDPHGPMYNLPDDTFKARLRELNGTPQEAWQHPELMEMVLPLLRADCEVADTYRLEPGERVSCPVSALGGLDDNEVGSEDIGAWREHTTGRFLQRMLPGDHFFIDSNSSDVLEAVAQDLSSILPVSKQW
jgi:medium-chain acyl-[acyl-carrier-protein] hydrolase